MVGKEKWAKEKELCLSDAYIVKDNEPSLELKVKVINIRPEEHHEILEKCQVLKEYSQFRIDCHNVSHKIQISERNSCLKRIGRDTAVCP